MENELIYKIFKTNKQIIKDTYIDNYTSIVTQPVFDYVIEFTNLEMAIWWRKENQNFENEYTIVPCY